MATRNRTLLFNKYRDALKGVRAPTSSPAAAKAPLKTSSGGAPPVEMASTSFLHSNRSYTALSSEDPGNSSKGAATVGLPPAWVDVSEEIASNVQRARVKMNELAKAHAKALMPSFGDGKEDQQNIEALTNEITNLLKKSEKKLLQKLSAAGPSEDSNVRKNVQRQLATDLQNLSMELRKKQSTYLKCLRQQMEDAADLEMNLNGNRPKEEDDDLDDMIFGEHQMAKLKQSEIVESVNELAQIMKDLSVLVIDQGTIVDRIDYNIQNVATTVEEGLKQLQKVCSLCPNINLSSDVLCGSSFLYGLDFAGGENTETRRNGDVCYSACYYVLCHASPLNPQGDNLLICKRGFS
ncbi:syntaxin-43-like isoform X1 [Gossypium australe]|uniref:Syntaxin-43-like isoform X1 n=1 Tax=Gossypium australe TaxID=47621 RepID=A0A5B6W499_9ROSI|nr:syntaxin-43-like isoform X1 [Gossypium australe]